MQLIVNVLVNDDFLGPWINRHGRGHKEFVVKMQDPMPSMFRGEDDWLRKNCSFVDDEE